jgi:hypothetical protein
VPQVFKVLGAVVAPTSLVLGLLFYFGRVHATTLTEHFGVNVTALDLTFNDHLIRSVDAAGIPVVIVLGLGLLVLWLHQVLVGIRRDAVRRRVLRTLVPVAIGTGAVLVTVAMADLVGVWRIGIPEGRGLGLAVGVLLLAYAVHVIRLLRSGRRASAAPRQVLDAVAVAQGCVVFALVSIGLFWAVAGYAGGVGRQRAEQIAATLVHMPETVLYSAEDLSLRGPGISTVPCGDEAAYRYRYTGLVLLLQSGSQYLLLPEAWTGRYGRAILIPRDEAVRLEFGQPGLAVEPTC